MNKAILIIAFLLSSLLFADNVSDGYTVFYGKVVIVKNKIIEMKKGCKGSLKIINLHDYSYIEFDSICEPPDIQASTSPLTSQSNCNNKKGVFIVVTKQYQTTYLDSIVMNNRNNLLSVVYSKNRGRATFSLSKSKEIISIISRISYRLICEADFPDNFPLLDIMK